MIGGSYRPDGNQPRLVDALLIGREAAAAVDSGSVFPRCVIPDLRDYAERVQAAKINRAEYPIDLHSFPGDGSLWKAWVTPYDTSASIWHPDELETDDAWFRVVIAKEIMHIVFDLPSEYVVDLRVHIEAILGDVDLATLLRADGPTVGEAKMARVCSAVRAERHVMCAAVEYLMPTDARPSAKEFAVSRDIAGIAAKFGLPPKIVEDWYTVGFAQHADDLPYVPVRRASDPSRGTGVDRPATILS